MSAERKTYTINFKLEAVEFAQQNSIAKAAEKFGVHLSQIKRWKSQKQLMEETQNKDKKVAKRLRGCKWPALEAYLVQWIINEYKCERKITGSTILQEAKSQAFSFGYYDFKGSPHWIYQFMSRNKIARLATTPKKKKRKGEWDDSMKKVIDFVNEMFTRKGGDTNQDDASESSEDEDQKNIYPLVKMENKETEEHLEEEDDEQDEEEEAEPMLENPIEA